MNICYLIIFRRIPITGPIYLPISLIQNVPQQIVSNILNFYYENIQPWQNWNC